MRYQRHDVIGATGRQLDALIAYAVFGWRWYEKTFDAQVQAILLPPDSDKWVRWNYFAPEFKLIDDWWPNHRHKQWDCCASPACEVHDNYSKLSFLPYWSTDLTKTTEVEMMIQDKKQWTRVLMTLLGVDIPITIDNLSKLILAPADVHCRAAVIVESKLY